MTRKDYILIAAALKDAREQLNTASSAYCITTWHRALNAAGCALAVELAKDNPRFDRNRFLVAAGVRSEE